MNLSIVFIYKALMQFANSQNDEVGAGARKEILLCTLNSAYIHSSFGLRYLFANLAELQDRARILEFTTDSDATAIVGELLKALPQEPEKKCVVGFGVYIWNCLETEKVISILKKVRPDVCIVLGGPEVSFETRSQALIKWSDVVITGEADFSFRDFCRSYFSAGNLSSVGMQQNTGLVSMPEQKSLLILNSVLPEIGCLASPYEFYTAEDIQNRVVYVEASRGCPYKCEYCLSSLDKSVRNFPLDAFLKDLQMLIDRGARQFKFIDRTFNLNSKICTQILQFFIDRMDLGLFLHFEMVPDRLPLEIRPLLRQFPAGSLQFEIGIQTLNPTVASLVSRKNDLEKVRSNFQFLKNETQIHTHADLIAGLPGEDLNSFAAGFDQLLEMGPDEIQLGILKRLKGTPIIRHDKEWAMTYSAFQPFEILSTKTMSFQELEKLKQFSKHWDWVANSGRFKKWISFWSDQCRAERKSFFWEFLRLSNFVFSQHPSLHGLSHHRLRTMLRDFSRLDLHLEASMVDELIPQHEPQNPKNSKHQSSHSDESRGSQPQLRTPKRQQQHLQQHP